MYCVNWAGGDKFRKKIDFGYRNFLKPSRMQLKPIHRKKIEKESVCHPLFCYIILEQKITGRIKICFNHCEKIKSRSKETRNSIKNSFGHYESRYSWVKINVIVNYCFKNASFLIVYIDTIITYLLILFIQTIVHVYESWICV